ncbi:MAG: pyridoxamine kinase [Clostridiales bacterium]|nr:pyridoxamine kinase [Clostridiales bacterium]
MRAPIQRVAAVHDLSGFGKSSLTMIIPILSAMGIQVCPLPTAVLSTQTGEFEGYKFVDFTDHMEDFIDHWHSLGIKFDCIYTGFLGSPRQAGIIKKFISNFHYEGQLVVIDPVMGDDGELYSSMDNEMVEGMKELIGSADIITPNMTEAAFLLDEPCKDKIDKNEIKDWLLRLSAMGPKTVIITSVPAYNSDKWTYVAAYSKEDGCYWAVRCDYMPVFFPGTGDGFTSVLVGSILQGNSLPVALDRAAQFISSAIKLSCGYEYPRREGVLLEKVLDDIKLPLTKYTCEQF